MEITLGKGEIAYEKKIYTFFKHGHWILHCCFFLEG